MFNIFKKRKTEWQMKIRCVFFYPYRVEEINLCGKTKRKVQRLFKQLQKKSGNCIIELLSECKEVPI